MLETIDLCVANRRLMHKSRDAYKANVKSG